MRPAFVIVLLLIAMHEIMPLGVQGLGAESLLAFGFLILAAWSVSELTEGIRLPHIVAFLLAGIIFGPYGLGTLSGGALLRLNPVSQLAISLIAFLAGSELRLADLKARGVAMVRIMTAEMMMTFVLVFAFLMLIFPYLPFADELPPAARYVFSLLFASIAVAHSPAAALALLSETGARGPVARGTLSVILISDIAVVILVSVVTAVCRLILPTTEAGLSFLDVVWEIGGALLVGAVLGLGIAVYLRFVHRELVLFAVLLAFFGGEIARLLHVDALLLLIVAGFITENFAPGHRGEQLRHAMERSAAPIFVVFFALAGAKIDLPGLQSLAIFVVPIFLVRMLGIYTGTRIGTRWAKAAPDERKYLWMGLVSQAGVALGLATLVADIYPTLGNHLRTMLLALIALNEMFGPILFRRALAQSGEIQSGRGSEKIALHPPPRDQGPTGLSPDTAPG